MNASKSKRVEHLDDRSVTPGAVYADERGNEYLFLGRIRVDEGFEAGGATVFDVGDNCAAAGFAFSRLTKTTRKLLDASATMDDYVDKLVETQNFRWVSKLSVRKRKRKFVELVYVPFGDFPSTLHDRERVAPPVELENGAPETGRHIFRVVTV